MANVHDHVAELEAAISWCLRHRAVVDFSASESGVAVRVNGKMFIAKTFLDVIQEAMHEDTSS